MPSSRRTPELVTDRAAELLQTAQAGSPTALGQLLAIYRPLLKIEARERLDGLLRAKEDSSDVVQQSLLEAQAAFGRKPFATQYDFANWLVKILQTNVADLRKRYRRGKRDVRRERPQAGPEWENYLRRNALLESGLRRDPVVAAEELQRLREAIAQLPEKYALILAARYRQQLTLVEIARQIGKSPDAVAKLYRRALRRLATLLTSTDHDR